MPALSTHRLDSQDTTILFAWRESIPQIAYLGSRLPDDFNCDAFVRSQIRPVGHATLDIPAPVSMQPEAARGFMGHPGLSAHRMPDNQSGWAGVFILANTQGDKNSVEFTCEDTNRHLILKLTCKLDPTTNVATFKSKLTNTASDRLWVDWFSAPALPIPQSLDEVISFSGRWCSEFTTDRRAVPIGQDVRENRRGRTSKQAFPGVILLTPTTDENMGECLGVHLGWSGNHKRILERMSSGACQLQMGALYLPGECALDPEQSIETPEIHVAHSNQGLNGMSQAFHHHFRQNILNLPNADKPRPVTVNTWEALYFDHRLDRLKALADAAQKVGAERYVLDDGWFIGRNDDTTSLGDWYPDPQKYPDGLHPIVDYVVDEKQLEFGLWVEPEMINADSNLYRQHPDWVLQLPPYPLLEGRQQLVLDITHQDVSDYLYERLSALLTEYRISYLKWDMNRDHVLPADQSGSPVSFRYTKALYALLDKLRLQFPHVEIESCASGGGRIDFEILKRTHRVWASDSNDAVERARIQTGFSYFLPPEVMGAHIGPTWCHTSGRGFHPQFRALVASYGHLGLELDLTNISPQDMTIFQTAVSRYKSDRSIWHGGTVQRIRTVDPNLFGMAAISTDQFSARVVMMQIDRPRSTIPPTVKIFGLKSKSKYKITLQTDPAIALRNTRVFDNPLMTEMLEMTGQTIMSTGIQLPILQAQSGFALALERTA